MPATSIFSKRLASRHVLGISALLATGAAVACSSDPASSNDLNPGSVADAGNGGSVDSGRANDTDAGAGDAGGTNARDGAGHAGDAGADGGGSSLPSIASFVVGTNLSGAEFGSAVPGTVNVDYAIPTHQEVDYFVGKGFHFFRIGFSWERMQPALGQALDPTYLAQISDLVTYVTTKGAYALVDPHNYARYKNVVIGSTDPGAPTDVQFGDFWAKLAAPFASNPLVVFGLMNEPNSMATELWLRDANAAIAAIRATGANNVITVPGNNWTGAHSWSESGYGTPNSTVMLGVVDPLDNFIYEVHQYLDSDSSGTHADCVSTTIGSQALTDFTAWLKTNHKRAILGEFGSANNATCNAALDDMLHYIDQNRDVWAGWTWWSAGPWWGGYMYSIEPNNGADAPQLATLVKHL